MCLLACCLMSWPSYRPKIYKYKTPQNHPDGFVLSVSTSPAPPPLIALGVNRVLTTSTSLICTVVERTLNGTIEDGMFPNTTTYFKRMTLNSMSHLFYLHSQRIYFDFSICFLLFCFNLFSIKVVIQYNSVLVLHLQHSA